MEEIIEAKDATMNAILGKLDILSHWASAYNPDLSKHIKETREQLIEILEA